MKPYVYGYIAGIVVLHDPASPQVAHAIRLWPRKRIVVGPAFFRLSAHERMAVLHHEAFHCLAFHLEKRFLLIPIFWTRLAARIVARQELAADRFAAQHGYGPALLNVVRRFSGDGDEFYPTRAERCAQLVNASRENLRVAA